MINLSKPYKFFHNACLFTSIIFIAGFFVFPDNGLHNTFFLLGVLPFFAFIVRDIGLNTQVFRHPLFYCILAYLLYLSLSGFWTPTDQSVMQWYKPFVRSLYILVFCLTVAYISSAYPALFERALTVLALCAAIGAILSIGYWWMSYDGNAAHRLQGVTRADHAIQGAASYGLVFLLALTRMNHTVKWTENLFYLTVAFLCLLFIVLAQTRGVLIGLIAASLVLFTLKQQLKSFLYLGVFVLITLGLSVLWIDWTPLWERLVRSMPHRPEIWLTVFQASLDKPWFGHGFLHSSEVVVSTGTFSHPHNIYLATFFQGGIVGLVFYAAMVLCALYYAFKHRNEGKYLFALIGIVFASVALLSDVGRLLVSPRDVWLYFWFPLAIILSSPK